MKPFKFMILQQQCFQQNISTIKAKLSPYAMLTPRGEAV
jgi:hypothetical protein